MPTLYQIIIAALISAFVVLFLDRTGVRDYVIERAKIKVVSEAFACLFCLCFWVNFIVCVFMLIFTNDAAYAYLYFLSTPITRFLA